MISAHEAVQVREARQGRAIDRAANGAGVRDQTLSLLAASAIVRREIETLRRRNDTEDKTPGLWPEPAAWERRIPTHPKNE